MGEAPVSRHTAAPIGSSWVRLAPNSTTAALRETAKANKHGRYKNWPEKRAKEKYYLGEIKRVMQEAREAGLFANR